MNRRPHLGHGQATAADLTGWYCRSPEAPRPWRKEPARPKGPPFASAQYDRTPFPTPCQWADSHQRVSAWFSSDVDYLDYLDQLYRPGASSARLRPYRWMAAGRWQVHLHRLWRSLSLLAVAWTLSNAVSSLPTCSPASHAMRHSLSQEVRTLSSCRWRRQWLFALLSAG